MLNHILLGASPPTGDSFPTWPLLILILAALAIITFVILKRQNKKAAVTDFAQIDLEADVPDTSFAEDNSVNRMQAKEEISYDADVSDDDYKDDYDEGYDEEIEDAYEHDQRNFETTYDGNDEYDDEDEE